MQLWFLMTCPKVDVYSRDLASFGSQFSTYILQTSSIPKVMSQKQDSLEVKSLTSAHSKNPITIT